MKRRQQRPAVEPPPELMEFDPEQWPQGGYTAWHNARGAWAAEHGYSAFGGVVPKLCQDIEVKRRLMGLPPIPETATVARGAGRRVWRPTDGQ